MKDSRGPMPPAVFVLGLTEYSTDNQAVPWAERSPGPSGFSVTALQRTQAQQHQPFAMEKGVVLCKKRIKINHCLPLQTLLRQILEFINSVNFDPGFCEGVKTNKLSWLCSPEAEGSSLGLLSSIIIPTPSFVFLYIPSFYSQILLYYSHPLPGNSPCLLIFSLLTLVFQFLYCIWYLW